MRKSAIYTALRITDLLGLPLSVISGIWLKNVRRAQNRLPLSKRALKTIGVLPVIHHYYEPVVYAADLVRPLSEERDIPGLDLNIQGQLDLLAQFKFNEDLAGLPTEEQAPAEFYYQNRWFESGDAEVLFNMVRYLKPSRIIEVGGGYSTLMIQYALAKAKAKDASYTCDHTCIEPYEQPWLDLTGVNLVRERVETLNTERFRSLGQNDILFIDSSHVIRPQGDVVFELLQLLGTLEKGVYVHLHDIFTPRDYPEEWVLRDAKLWNEQYLLQAFLCLNNDFEVTWPGNYMLLRHPVLMQQLFPEIAVMRQRFPSAEASAFWMRRRGGEPALGQSAATEAGGSS